MNRKKMAMRIGLVAGWLAIGAIVGCGNRTSSGQIDGDIGAAIMPGANLIVFYDVEAARKAPINEAFKALSDNLVNLGEELQGQDVADLQQHFKRVTGLDDDDFSSFVFAISLDGIDFEAAEPPSLEQLDMVAAIGLKKAVSGEKLVEFIEFVAAEQDEEPTISETIHNGVTIYTISGIGDAGQGSQEFDLDVVSMAMIDQGLVCLIGPQAALQSAIDRALSGRLAAMSPAMDEVRKTVADGAVGYLSFTMTEKLKSMAGEEADRVSPEDPMASLQTAMADLEGASISMLMGQQATFKLTGVFADPGAATNMTAFFNNMVISSVRMFAGMMLGQRPLPMLQSLQAGHQDRLSTLEFSISEQDIQSLQELAAEGTGGEMF